MVDRRCLRANFIIEIRPVERGFEHGSIVHSQIFLDIVLHFRRCCGRKGYQRLLSYFVYDRTDAPVFRAKVVPPFRYAMSLVDGIERDGNCLEKFDIVLFCQRFRSYIEQFRASRGYITLHLIDGRFGQGGIQEVGHMVAVAYIAHRIDLIFHQGNQWRDYNRRTTKHQSRKLIAQRLSATCRHNDKCVAPVEQIKYYLLLVSFEFIETEMMFQRLGKCAGFRIDAVSALHGKGRLVKGEY